MSALLLLAILAQEKLAPYTGVRWPGPEVELDGAWVELVAIDGLPAAEIVAFCERTYGDRWRKRFEEDLVEVMGRMGRPPGRTVKLEVREKGVLRVHADVPMTKENRRRIWEAARDPVLPRAALEQDVEQLREALRTRYAYFKRRKVSLDAPLAGDLRRSAFAVEVGRLLDRFGDGHTGVAEELASGEYLPFLVGESGGRYVAFQTERDRFVDPERPFLRSIDGLPVADCVKAAGGVRRLRELGAWHPKKAFVRVGLASEAGEVVEETLPVFFLKPLYGDWPEGGHRLLDGNIGYLRIARMHDDAAGVERALDGFLETRGLIIDVRGNGGGSRAILSALLPRFLAPGELAVANVAAPRGPADLSDRGLFSIERWSGEERAALERFAAGFKPEWAPPAGEFGAWHYFAVRAAGRRYEKPVVILQDGDCFSATDVFLGAFKGRPGVTLMGTSSAGGSGRPRSLTLKNSGLVVRMSTMASYRPDGSLYEGKGVAPDVELHPEPGYFIGRSDAVLDAARRALTK